MEKSKITKVQKMEMGIEIVKASDSPNKEIVLECLEHEIELSNPKNARDGYKIYKEIREVRIRRRQAKNENELLKDLYDLLKEQSSQKIRNKIQQIQQQNPNLNFIENISIAVKTIVKANNIHAHSDGLNGNAFLHVCFSAIT